MSDAKTAPLPEYVMEFPEITINGKDYSSLTFREPKFKEFKTATAKSAGDSTVMMGHLMAMTAGVDMSVIDMLPITKIEEGAAYLAGFFGAV